MVCNSNRRYRPATMDEDLISIIMPAYNAEKYIAESIESVIKQTYQNWELIIIDDGSTDRTAEMVNNFKSDRRIKYFYQSNGKQGKARNLGIKKSTGEYIAFLDADDKWASEKLSIQMTFLSADHMIDLLFSQGYSVEDDLIKDYNVCVKDLWDQRDVSTFIDQNQIPILSVLVRKDALTKVNNFSESENIQNVEDYHLWLKLLIHGCKFKSIPDRLFYYRIHRQQATFQNNNTDWPSFYLFEDIYDLSDKGVKKVIINKLKWLIFKNEFHASCIKLFTSHFTRKKLGIISYAIKKWLSRPMPFQQKIVFTLVTRFG